MEDLTRKLIVWIKEGVAVAHCQGVVVGLSGGVDSSVVAVLCKRAFPRDGLGGVPALRLPGAIRLCLPPSRVDRRRIYGRLSSWQRLGETNGERSEQPALAAGALTIDGLDMLVWQGAMAFQLWTGQEAPLEVMTKAAADALKSDVGGDHIEVGSAEGQSPFPEGLGFTLKVYPEGVFPQPDKSPKSGGFRGLISVPKHTLKTNIALIGFMGAGKTEVGKILAQRLGRRFVEIDALIENRANKSIAGIFQQDGELAFRELELDITKDVAAGENQVIAGGGGIVLNKINVDRLQKGAVIVYLAASPAAIIRRTGQAQGVRPLLNVSDKAGKISELLRFRKPLYESAADITVNTSRLSVNAVADKIIAELKKYESSG